jgi:hypothetical protein
VNFGDSLAQAFGTLSLQNDPFHLAAEALSTTAFPIITAKVSYQGQTSITWQANAYKFCPGVLPDVAFFKSDSPNDGAATTAICNASASRAFAFCDWATRQGIVPVISTYQPWGYSGSNEQARLTYNGEVRNSGWLFLDYDTILADPSSPNNILSAYISTAAPPHYNDLGSQALATRGVVPILQRIVATRPR